MSRPASAGSSARLSSVGSSSVRTVSCFSSKRPRIPSSSRRISAFTSVGMRRAPSKPAPARVMSSKSSLITVRRSISSRPLRNTRWYSRGLRSARSATSISPRRAVNGERSSWLTSAVSRRWFLNAASMRSSMRFKTATNPRYSSVSACAMIRRPSVPASMRVACSVISDTGRTAEPASHHAPTRVAPVPTTTTPASTSNNSRCIPAAGPSATALALVHEAIEFARPIAEKPGAPCAATPDQRSHAGQQLVELERLGEIVVGAGVEPPHHVLRRIARGEHQDGRLTTLAPQLRRDLKPVLLRQHHVQDHEVVVVHVRQGGGFLTIRRNVDRIPLFPEPLLDEAGDLPIIFHDKDFHGSENKEQAWN